MRNKLGDEIRLKHILDATEEIENYLIEIDFPVFTEKPIYDLHV